MNYQEALQWMDERQQFTIKLGLATTRTLLAQFGNPHKQLRIIHIAGTNGKGSVGATLLAILSAAGYRTGFYSSPHLSDFRERFRLNTTFITQERCADLITTLATGLPEGMQPTYFECATLLALLWFADQQTDAVILETGMGGRLDATNAVTPLLSIITDISLDHEQYLGSTITAIANEKAGIIKSEVPVIFSGRHRDALPVIMARCRQQNSPLYLYGQHFSGARSGEQTLTYQALTGRTHPRLPLPLQGDHQIVNTSLALAALELLDRHLPVTPDQWHTGLQQVHWPGRLERFSVVFSEKTVDILLDGAHNEAGVLALLRSVQQMHYQRLFLLWGNMSDKVLGPAYLELLDTAEMVVLTRPESPRSAEPLALFAELPIAVQQKTTCISTVEQAMIHLLERTAPGDLLCIAGSLYLVGHVRQQLLGDPV